MELQSAVWGKEPKTPQPISKKKVNPNSNDIMAGFFDQISDNALDDDYSDEEEKID